MDKKLTDNETIKALECCAKWENGQSCEECPANTYSFGCAQIMAKHSLDLINRKEAEVDSWKLHCHSVEVSLSEQIKLLLRVNENRMITTIKHFMKQLRLKRKFFKVFVRFKDIVNIAKEMTGEDDV